MSETPAPDRTPALIALGVVQLLFGCMPVVGKLAIPAFGAEGVVFARIAGAAVAFGIARGVMGMGLPWSAHPRVMMCAALGVVSNQLLFMNGLARTSASHAALLTTTIPALTLLVAVAFGIERLTPRRVAGLLIAGLGAALLITVRGGAGTATVLGDLLIVCNATVYSLYLVLSRPLLAQHGAVPVLAALFGWGVVMVVPFTGVTLNAAPNEAWAALIFLVLGPTIGSYGLNLFAMRTVPASTVALWIYVQPLVTAVLAVPLLGETPTPIFVVAGVLTFVGMWLGR